MSPLQLTENEQRERAIKILTILKRATQGMVEPMSITIRTEYDNNPFLILISCLLSLRAKDTATLPVSRELFSVAQSPRSMLELSVSQIEKIIYSIGFYKQKARQIHEVSSMLLEKFGGNVPDTEEELLSIRGVGRKTAALVLSIAFDQPAICVDVHVHRIANRLGLVQTRTPEQTEIALKRLLPQEWWGECNRLFVMWGQNICTPVSPKCSSCALVNLCPRIGVTTSR